GARSASLRRAHRPHAVAVWAAREALSRHDPRAREEEEGAQGDPGPDRFADDHARARSGGVGRPLARRAGDLARGLRRVVLLVRPRRGDARAVRRRRRPRRALRDPRVPSAGPPAGLQRARQLATRDFARSKTGAVAQSPPGFPGGEPPMTTTVLVTGGAGFIGSHFVHVLVELRPGWRIVKLGPLAYPGNPGALAGVQGNPRYAFVHGDIRKEEDVERAFEAAKGSSRLLMVHFAAESHVDRSIQSGLPFVTTNVAGTQVLLDAARRHRVARFVHV